MLIRLSLSFCTRFLQAQVNDWKLEGKSGLCDVGTIASHWEIQELDRWGEFDFIAVLKKWGSIFWSQPSEKFLLNNYEIDEFPTGLDFEWIAIYWLEII